MSTLETVTDYISDARYRYDDQSLLVAFNVTLLDARRLRPDLFVYRHDEHVPSFSALTPGEVEMEPQFRLPLVYGLVGHALARASW